MFYILLPIAFPFCVLEPRHEDQQRDHTKDCTKSSQSWLSSKLKPRPGSPVCTHIYACLCVCIYIYIWKWTYHPLRLACPLEICVRVGFTIINWLRIWRKVSLPQARLLHRHIWCDLGFMKRRWWAGCQSSWNMLPGFFFF